MRKKLALNIKTEFHPSACCAARRGDGKPSAARVAAAWYLPVVHGLTGDRKFRLVAALLLALTAEGQAQEAPASPASEAPSPLPGSAGSSERSGLLRWGLSGLKAPPRWEVQPAGRTYPQLLFFAQRVQGDERAVMTLVVQRLTKGTSVHLFADQSLAAIKSGVRGLKRQNQSLAGRSWGGHRVQVDGQVEDGASDARGPASNPAPRRVMRQIYFVNGPLGYVLSLVAPQAQAIPRQRDLEDVFRNLEMLPVDAPEAEAGAREPEAGARERDGGAP